MESDTAHDSWFIGITGNEQKRNKIQFNKLNLKVEDETEEKKLSILKLNFERRRKKNELMLNHDR